MLKKFVSYTKTLDFSPLYFFSERRRGLKYRRKRHWDKDEPTNYVPLPQTQSKKEEYTETVEGSQHKFDRYSVHPHSYWLTQGKGTERPFTGIHWDRKDVGHYECVVCSNKLFLSDHKFQLPIGQATFWNAITGSIEFSDDIAELKEDKTNITTRLYDTQGNRQRCMCAKCKSHLGMFTKDGPPPLFIRYTINSGAMNFIDKPWFHPPQYYRKLRLAAEAEKIKQTKEADVVDKFKFNREKFKEVENSAKQEK